MNLSLVQSDLAIQLFLATGSQEQLNAKQVILGQPDRIKNILAISATTPNLQR